MKRKIIEIDAEKCNGCGLCVDACREGAIGLEGGKAKLLRDDYCDGLGACLPVCPAGALSFVEREAAAYNAEGAEKNPESPKAAPAQRACACPGTAVKTNIPRTETPESAFPDALQTPAVLPSRLAQWPVQIKLVPESAPFFMHARLLIAADCTAYACANFHAEFMRNRITLIGCPKLDEGDYTEKLTAILRNNDIKSLTVVRMEVPCCAGIVNAAVTALKECGKMIPWQTAVISTGGRILTDE